MYSINPTPYSTAKELAQRVKAIRKKKKLSQATFAEKSGVSLGSIKRFERTGQISLESLLKLAHLLNRLSDFTRVFQETDEPENLEDLFLTKA